MSSQVTILFLLALAFAALQTVLCHPGNRFDPLRVQRDIIKDADNVAKDIKKEVSNHENKVAKEVKKLLKKAGLNADLAACLRAANEEATTQLKEQNDICNECVDSVKESIKAALGEGSMSAEMYYIRQQHKDNIKECKNDSKDKIKEIHEGFKQAASQCILA